MIKNEKILCIAFLSIFALLLFGTTACAAESSFDIRDIVYEVADELPVLMDMAKGLKRLEDLNVTQRIVYVIWILLRIAYYSAVCAQIGEHRSYGSYVLRNLFGGGIFKYIRKIVAMLIPNVFGGCFVCILISLGLLYFAYTFLTIIDVFLIYIAFIIIILKGFFSMNFGVLLHGLFFGIVAMVLDNFLLIPLRDSLLKAFKYSLIPRP
jgi:hypothetical protein